MTRRETEWTPQFKRDYKKVLRGHYGKILNAELFSVLASLAVDVSLDVCFHDHALKGEWQDFRDCHIRPDLVLIYCKPDAVTLRLVRLGSHSELGL